MTSRESGFAAYSISMLSYIAVHGVRPPFIFLDVLLYATAPFIKNRDNVMDNILKLLLLYALASCKRSFTPVALQSVSVRLCLVTTSGSRFSNPSKRCRRRTVT